MDGQLQGSQFTTTHWSAVLEAGKQDSPAALAALEELCRTYWYPLYAFVRRQGHSPEEAEDLTQSFFERLIEKDYVKLADPERGKFRSFLLSALKNFLTNEWARSARQKRGGGYAAVRWDRNRAEQRYALEPVDQLTPERIFEKQWAITLLEQVLARLKQEQIEAGREGFFDEVKGWLWGDKGTTGYAELAGQLGLTEPALKSAVHRLRLRYRELLREEIGRTVATPLEVQEELEGLMAVLRS
ncbi:MAG TPA: sigma-70 family RNA polymerase sigma factor [Verrucomicrobiae bacterium]